jgi:hypothetical protein
MFVIDIPDDELGGMGQTERPIRNRWRGYNRNRANLCVESPAQDFHPIARAPVYPGGWLDALYRDRFWWTRCPGRCWLVLPRTFPLSTDNIHDRMGETDARERRPDCGQDEEEGG